MGARPVIQCVGPSYPLADRKSAVQRAVNLHMREVEGLGEARQVVLASAPGLTLALDLGATVRGLYATDTRLFAVAGATLFEVVAGVAVALGTLGSVAGHVSMKHGRDQLLLTDGVYGYVLRLTTNAFATITSGGWRGSFDVEELDGYFVFLDPGTDQFYLSQIDDGSSLDALDFSSADAQPDDLVTHRVLKRELFLFGTASIEVWIDSGGADFPFVRYNSTPIDVGIVGRRAAVNAADTLFFVGQTPRGAGTVYVMSGHQPVRVSTQAVEEALAGADLSQCSMWAYQIAGAEFVGVNAPGMATTWVYDAAAKQWHERGEWVDGDWAPLRVDCLVTLAGVHYASAGTKLYTQRETVTTLAGDPLMRERTWPHLVTASDEPVSYPGLSLQCTTGYGGNVTLEISNNGGFTFGPPLKRSLGAIGRWMQPVRWLMLGSAKDRVFRLRCADDVPLTIHGATLL